MSTTAVTLLGVIAVATLVMAIVQIGLIVVAVRLARKVNQLGTQFELDVRPLVAHAGALAENAARASSLVVLQVERADRMVADLTQRVEDTMSVVQTGLLSPVRQGRALMAGVAAALTAFHELRRTSRDRPAVDDDDPLFIG